MLTIEERVDIGYLIIRTNSFPDVYIHLPIIKHKILDQPEGFAADALIACSKYVPEMPGIADRFRCKMSQYEHRDTAMLMSVYDFVRDNLLYGLFNPNNPGHLFVLIQCFGGYWAGIASQYYATILLEECTKYKMQKRSSHQNEDEDDRKEIDLMIGVIGCICKCFGCSARTPLMPHYPTGLPPDPVVLLADTIVYKHKHLQRGMFREELIKQLHNWQVPKYMRKHPRNIWMSQNYIDRTKAFIETNVINRQ